MKERSYNVRDEEETADREMKEKCLDVNGEHDAEKKAADCEDGGKSDRPGITFSERAKQLRTNTVGIIIVLLCVLLLVFFIIIIALAVRVGRLEGRTDPKHCDSSECLSASAKIVSHWNTTFDPCHDFWNFSCGEWLIRNPLPNNKGSFGVLDLLQEKVRTDLRHLLDLVPHDAPIRDPEWKSQRFFHTCMNLDSVEQTGNVFRSKLNEIGGWTILNNWSRQRWDQNKVLKTLQLDYGVTPFFKFVVGPDDASPKQNIVKILPSGLGLPGPSYYFLPPDNKYETIYRTYMDDIARQLGATALEASRFASNTFNYEKRLAEVMPSAESYRDPFSLYKKLSVQQLSSLAPTIQWLDLLQNAYPSASINHMTEVVIFSEPYFKQLSNILSSTDKLAMHNYLMWQFTYTYAPHLSSSYREIANRFHQSLEGLSNPMLKNIDHWEYCLKITSQYLGHALGAMYIKKYFVPDSTNEAVGVEKQIQEVFKEYASSVPWADDQNTITLIREKIESLLSFHGYPDFILKSEALSDYYNSLEVQSEFLTNILAGKKFLLKRQELQLSTQVTGDESWSIFSQDVQPVYQYQGNELVVPAGLLQSPLYDPGFPFSVRFGSLGTHIGSQLFKALDDEGISYEKHGSLDPWLSGRSALQYQKKLECLKDSLLEGDETGSLSVNLTVGEFMADIAAVKFAYKAYRNMESEHSLPGVGRNHDQVFFISYAQSMCEHIRPEKVNAWSEVSVTSPRHKRVINTLRQLPEFSEAFGCPSGSNMNPAGSCRMW